MRAASLLLASMPLWAVETEHEHHASHSHHAAQSEFADSPIHVTVNPEARVSVRLAGKMPTPAACGMAVDLPVRIVNQGFLTARLEVRWVGTPPPGAVLEFAAEPLKGVPEELRVLRVTLDKPGTTDLTLAFQSADDLPDLGGRYRIHFLMSCYAMTEHTAFTDQ